MEDPNVEPQPETYETYEPDAQPESYDTYPPEPESSGPNWPAIILGVLLVIVLIGGFALFSNQQDGQVAQGGNNAPAPPPQEPAPPAEEPAAPAEPVQPEEPEAPISSGSGDSVQLPEVCNSLGIAGGFILLGSVLNFRKRSSSRRRDYKL